MRNKSILYLGVLFVGCLYLFGCQSKDARPGPDFKPLDRLFTRLVEQNRVAGAQVAVGRIDQILYQGTFGRVGSEKDRPVDPETLFCIGSCSKTFTAAVLMSLVDEGLIVLDSPIDGWLPSFSSLRIAGDGPSERAPTMRELLSHQSGIYSQKHHPTQEQMTLIRDFSLTLEQSVEAIAKQELRTSPGTEYAYSGAGFCVAGRVAEVAAGVPFEELLQERICRPLGLTRTTYFPALKDGNVAVDFDSVEDRLAANTTAPHLLGPEHRFPLIGGSIYSTAGETARFAQAVLNRGRGGSNTIMSEASWLEMTAPQVGLTQGSYALGWRVEIPEGKETPRFLQHNGRLGGYSSTIRIDLEKGGFLVANWTGPDPRAVHASLDEILRNLRF